MSFDLGALAKKASGSWATGSCTVSQLRNAARHLGWTEVRMRSDEAALNVLRPQNQAEAKPRSLSATFGLGPQPLHTDGAHLTHPPDWVALLAEEPNSTPTAVVALDYHSRDIPLLALLGGIFVVRSGPQTFLERAATGGRIRYDPGCMTPCDQRARTAAQFFADIEDVHEHEWNHKNEILLIDNRRALHARRGVAEADITSRALHRVAFIREVA